MRNKVGLQGRAGKTSAASSVADGVARRVQLLYWEGCPSHPEALALLREVIAERGLELEVELREVTSDAEAEALGFPGSPTILVDGRDIDEAGADSPSALTCRIYHLPDGRVSPIPNRQQLEDALQ